MELTEVLQKRHSCRSFTTESIPSMVISRLAWAAERAPYASGGPRRNVTCVRGPVDKEKLKEACYGQKYVSECAVAFVFSGRDAGTAVLKSGFSKFVHDCTAACMCVDLMATDMGYGTCWIGHFDPDKVSSALRLDGGLRPSIILLVGYET